MAKQKLRVDHVSIVDQMKFEDWLDGLANSGWKFISMVVIADNELLVIHKRTRLWRWLLSR